MGGYSPGVYPSESDQSYFVQTDVSLSMGAAIYATWGPIGSLGQCTSHEDYLNLYGPPPTDEELAKPWYVAREYFRLGSDGKISRIDSTTTPADYSYGSLRGGRTKVLDSGVDGTCAAVGGNDTFTVAGEDWVAKGVRPGMFLKIDSANPLHTNNGWFQITVVVIGTLTIAGEWPGGAMGAASLTYEVHTTQACGNIVNTAAIGNDGATSAATTRQLTSATAKFATLGKVFAGDIVVIQDAAAPAGTPGDNGVYTIVTVADTILTLDRDFPVGSLSNLTFRVYRSKVPVAITDTFTGTDGSMTLGSKTFTSAGSYFSKWDLQKGDILVVNEPAPSDADNGVYTIITVVGDTSLTLNRAAPATLGTLDFTIYTASIYLKGYYKGTRGNNFRMDSLVWSPVPEDFSLSLYESGVLMESFKGIDRTTIDDTGVLSSILVQLDGTPSIITGSTEPVLSAYSTVTGHGVFTGALDGSASASDANIITALNFFTNREEVDIDVLVCGGEDGQAVQAQMQLLCEGRGDCIALFDLPKWGTSGTEVDTVSEALAWTNGTYIRTAAVNTNVAACYWPEAQVYDEYNERNVWVPASGFVLYAMCKASKTGPWKPPAGWSRGLLPQIIQLRYSPTQAERDLMMSDTGSGQILNPLMKSIGKGICIFGQKTGYRSSSKLNRVNWRMTLNLIKWTVADAIEDLTFELSDETLWKQISMRAEQPLLYIKGQGGITNYRVRCDSSTNSSTALGVSNASQAYIWVLFPEVAEKIYLKFIVTPSGVNFEEYTTSLGE